MTWENFGKWEIDHKVACWRFDLNDPTQQWVCFHYTNLQPLWFADNRQKNYREASERAAIRLAKQGASITRTFSAVGVPLV
jgi:hypothetical protein